jgi:hypothetical protein
VAYPRKTTLTKAIIDEPSEIYEAAQTPVDDGRSVAEAVLRAFGLSGPIGGSSLATYDIHNKDPYQMIQLSLAAEAFTDGGPIKECYADQEGDVKFVALGTGAGPTEIYYSITNDTFKLECNNVLVEGYDPPPKRESRPKEDLFTLVDEDIKPKYHTMGSILKSKNAFAEGWIEYERATEDMLKQRFDIGDYETIFLTYAVTIPFFKAGSTDVQYHNTCSRFIELDNFGEMVEAAEFKVRDFPGGVLQADKGVEIEGSRDPKFLNVKRVILYGYKLERILYYRAGGEGNPSPWAFINTNLPNGFELRRGEDYVVNRENGVTKITFANNAKESYRGFFGTPGQTFKVHGESIQISDEKVIDPTVTVAGQLRDGGVAEVGQTIKPPKGLFPVGFGEAGYAVERIFVEVEWDNPCVYIKDDMDDITEEKLKLVEIMVIPIVIDDHPAPMSVNGVTVTRPVKDDDPTSLQLFSQSGYQQIIDSLSGGDIRLVLPFLDEEGANRASSRILALRNEESGDVTHVCGPNCNPDIGGVGVGGAVVNEISYSYQDSSQYVVSVNCGPLWRSIGTGWTTSIRMMQVDQLSLDGTVINAMANNADFTVMCSKIGQVNCVNATRDRIFTGDKVKVTIYNNAVGY